MAAPAHAGVRFPPPFVYVAGLLAGWLVDRWHRWPITPSGTRAASARIMCGEFEILVWLALFASAYWTFRRHKTTLVPNRPASAFVTDGPYRVTRNPMYVSLIVLYLGVMLLINTWWPLLFLPIVLVVIQRTVIAREERYLSAAFPQEFAAYAARVRRWL